MRGVRWLGGIVVLASGGCGLLSGLDQLTVDGGADAGVADANSTADALADVADGTSPKDADADTDADADANVNTPGAIVCGLQKLCTSGQQCCFDNNTLYSCAPVCGIGAHSLACDDPSDCTKGVCCGSVSDGGTDLLSSACKDVSCALILCDPNASDTCTLGLKCTGKVSFGFVETLGYCQ